MLSPLLRSLFVVLLLGLLTAGEPAATTATLTVWNRPLAELRVPINHASVQERAERAADRIRNLPVEALSATIEAKPAKVGDLSGTMFYAGPHFLFTLADQDLDVASGETMEDASRLALDRIRELFAARQEATRGDLLLRNIGWSVVASLVLLLVLLALWRLRRAFHARLRPELVARLPTIYGFNLRGTVLGLLRSAINLPFLAAILTALYLWLVLVLASFPYTRPWAQALGQWLQGLTLTMLHGVVAALPGLFVVVIIVVCTRFAARALSAFFTSIEQGRIQVAWMQPETARATRRIGLVLLWLFAIIVSYPYMPGSSSEAFKGISVFAGLMLTLGSSSMVNQVISGLMVAYARSMCPGDIVKVGDTTGTVVDLGLLSTRVRTPRLKEVSIPNAVLVGSTVINYSRHDGNGMAINANVTIGYDTPWRQVHALLQLAAARTPGVRTTPAPEVVQKALDDFYVAYELRIRIEQPELRFRIQSELHARIQDAFNEYGVQIMSPHFNNQPAQSVVVPHGGWAPAPARPDPA